VKKYTQIILAIVIGLSIGSTSSVFAEDIGQKVEAQFAKFRFIVDGEEKILEADPLVYQGTTYLPVRVVANMLGKAVVYRADSRTIELITPKPTDGVTDQNMIENRNILDRLRDQPPEIIRGVLKAREADLSRESDPEEKKKIEADIEQLKEYLKSIGEPISDEYFKIKEQLEVTQRNIEFTQEFLQHFPDNEDAKKHLHELEAEKARLESQLQTAE